MDRQLVSLVANDKINLSSLISTGKKFQIMESRYLKLVPRANLFKKIRLSLTAKICAGNKVNGILNLFRMGLFGAAHGWGDQKALKYGR